MKRPFASARRRSAGATLQWASALVLTVALPQAAAFAEVCDKMASSGQFGLVAAGTLALVCALAWYVRKAWVSALCAFICVLLALVAVLDLSQDHPVYRSAVIEGCRSRGGDMFEAFVLLAGAAFILASGWIRRRKTS